MEKNPSAPWKPIPESEAYVAITPLELNQFF